MSWKDRFLTRREMLQRGGMGMGAVALTSLLGAEGALAAVGLLRLAGSPVTILAQR